MILFFLTGTTLADVYSYPRVIHTKIWGLQIKTHPNAQPVNISSLVYIGLIHYRREG